MSYPQFGYAYSPTAAASSSLATSQLLGVGHPGSGLGSAAGGGGQTGGVSQTSSLPGGGGAATACCGGDSRTPGGGMGGPPGAAPGSDPSSPVGGGSQGTGSGVYSSSLLSYPRVAGLADSAAAVGSVYGSAYAAQGYVPFGGDPSAFYSPLTSHMMSLQGAADQQADAAWRNLSQPAAWPYDPTGMAGYPYGTSYGGLDVRRKNATRESTSTLKAWLYEHIKNPYPTKGEKIMLAIITKMTLTQVSTWFANARRRLKKENKMQWSPRNRTGDEDDDDKDGCSDGEDGGGGEKEGKAGDKHRDEDEDINIVDSGNDHGDQSLLSPSDGLAKIHPGSTSPSATSDPGSNTKPGGPVPAAHARDLFSDVLHHKPGGDLGGGSDPYSRHPLHGLHKASSACSLGGGGEDANGNKLDSPGSHHHPHDKPRIWSLADVATSNTGSLVAPHGLTSSSSGARGSPPGGGCALGGLSKTTAFSPPPPHHSSGGGGGFHPWSTTTNNSYGSGGGAGNNTPSGLSSSSPLGGSGGYNTSPFSSPHGTPVATPMGGLTTPGSGAQRHMAAGVTGANTPTQAGYTAAASSMHKFQNGLLGDSVKGSVTHSGYTDDGAAAFQPVPKRL